MQIRTSTIFCLTTFLTSNLQTRNNNATFPLQRQKAKAWWRNGNSSAVLRAWQRQRWLAKSSRALCNLLTLSELSQTSLPLWCPDLLEFMKRRRRNASQSKQLSNNLLFLQPPPRPPFLDRGNPPLFKLMVCSAEAWQDRREKKRRQILEEEHGCPL